MSDASRFGSFLAALGVIASLGLVAYELRQNTQAVVGQTLQALAEQQTELSMVGVDNPELRDAWSIAWDDPTALTEEQDRLLGWFYTGVMRITENRFRQYQIGTLDQEGVLQIGARGALFRQPFFKTWWPGERGYHTPEFAEFVDAELLPLEKPVEAETPEGVAGGS